MNVKNKHVKSGKIKNPGSGRVGRGERKVKGGGVVRGGRGVRDGGVIHELEWGVYGFEWKDVGGGVKEGVGGGYVGQTEKDRKVFERDGRMKNNFKFYWLRNIRRAGGRRRRYRKRRMMKMLKV